MAVRGIPFLEEQVVVLIVARGIDTAIERLGLLAGILESKTSTHKTRVTNLVGKLPGEEVLKGERLAFGVVPPRRLRARDWHVRRALNRLDTKPLRDAHVHGLGEQVEPYRGDTGAKAVFALVGLRYNVFWLIRMTFGKGAHLTAAIDHAESDGKVVSQSDAFVSIPKDLLQLVIEHGGRGDPHAP